MRPSTLSDRSEYSAATGVTLSGDSGEARAQGSATNTGDTGNATATSTAAPTAVSGDSGHTGDTGDATTDTDAGNSAVLGLPCLTADHETIDALQTLIEKTPEVDIHVNVETGAVTAGSLTFSPIRLTLPVPW